MSWCMLPETIRTARLVLRRHAPGDEDELFRYGSDPDFSPFFPPRDRPYTRADAKELIERRQRLDWAKEPHWVIELDGRIVGGFSLRIDHANRRAEIAYEVERAQRSKGLATEASQAVIDAAFRTLPDLNRIVARVDGRNEASIRVMEKLGMRREGVFRQHRVWRGVLTDETHYGLLRDEWASRSGGEPPDDAAALPNQSVPGPVPPARS